MVDFVDLKEEIDKLNTETLPLIHAQLHDLVKDLHTLLDRLDGAQITFTIPDKKNPAPPSA